MTILVLGGPTATGKTAAATAVADAFGAVIVSADAMQVYRGLDIGTAKPTPEEQARWPHHLVDIRDPHQAYNAADFAQDCDALIADHARVVVAGGTGFYIRALLTGLAPAPPSDPSLRAEFELLEDPHSLLQEQDPVLAERLHPNDRVRVLRGLEVFRMTGRRLSEIHAEHDLSVPRHAAIRLMLDRQDIKERIDTRVISMMEAGYVREVQGLLDAGITPALKPMKSLGYKWLSAQLLDDLDPAEALRLTQRDTRRFARKQRTMFRSIGGFEPIDGGDIDRVMRAAEKAFGSPKD
ncbi:MAG: tRNA dimethylallyltransferase [Cognaticolwellia sp.]|jgi:tRNA dimethylallyltransferase